MPLEMNGVTFATDQQGYLLNLGDWCPELAEAMAALEGYELTEAHWQVLHFLREYYHQYQLAPAMRVLAKAIGKRFGNEKGNSMYLFELFPQGPAKQASKYAGLPKPSGCI